MNIKTILFFLSSIFLSFAFLPTANAAAPFNSVSIQGYLKTSGGTPVNGTFNGKITLKQNSATCWDTGGALIPLVFTDGAFSKTLSAGTSSGACSGSLGSSHFLTTSPFTWTLELDMDSNTSVDTIFNNIPITPVPLAMVAEQLSGNISASQVAGGVFGASDGSAITNLSATNMTSGTLSPSRLGSGAANSTNFLRGDSTWQSVPASGEVNTASNLGAGSPVFKQKTAANLEFRSLAAASSKIGLTLNANDISIDVNEANLSLPNFSGSLSGSQVTGGTFGAIDGTNLTNLSAPNLVGTLPALDGAALTNLAASNIASGTVAAARLPAAGAATDGIVSASAQTIGGAKTFNGAVTLASTLSNVGPFAWTKTDVATVATIACLASSSPVVRLTGTTATVINGINPGAVDGQILVVYTDGNIGTGLTMTHNNAGACANGRIFTNTNANVVSTTATSTAAYIFIYNMASLRWHAISTLQ